MQVGEPLAEVKVKYSTDADTVKLYPADDMMTILPKNTDESVTQKTFQLPEYVTAPVKKGDVIGTVTLSLSGQTIGVVELTADRDLDRNMLLFTLSKNRGILQQPVLQGTALRGGAVDRCCRRDPLLPLSGHTQEQPPAPPPLAVTATCCFPRPSGAVKSPAALAAAWPKFI